MQQMSTWMKEKLSNTSAADRRNKGNWIAQQTEFGCTPLVHEKNPEEHAGAWRPDDWCGGGSVATYWAARLHCPWGLETLSPLRSFQTGCGARIRLVLDRPLGPNSPQVGGRIRSRDALALPIGPNWVCATWRRDRIQSPKRYALDKRLDDR
jgi:hypothetical protein